MKKRMITFTNTQILLIFFALYLAHLLIKEVDGSKDKLIEEVPNYPGINIKEF